jgi:DNA-binding NarL/FixJ family response regulator
VATVRVVVADDDLLVRAGLCSLLALSDAVEVCGTCESVPELLAAVEAHTPDVVLTDIRMPPDHRDEGVQAAQRLRATHPQVGVVVLSQYADPGYAAAVFAGGSRGRGYVLKQRVDDLDFLLLVITTVASGGSFIDEEVVEVLARGRHAPVDHRIGSLTPREQEVLAEVATGATNAGVAAALGISDNAVEKHINSIFAKLGLDDGRTVNRRVRAVLAHLESAALTEEPSR